MLAVESPLPQFFATDGSPLDGGRLYFGQPNQNPQTSPVTVFWDAAGTQPAAQPIRTLNGYAVRSGAPATLYVATDYSLNVLDAAGRLVIYAPTSAYFGTSLAVQELRDDLASTADAAKGDNLLGVKATDANAAARTQHDKNGDRLSVLDFAAGGADDTTRFQNAVNSRKKLFAPRGNYTISTVNLDVYGCDIECDKEAVFTITGFGFRRNLAQSPRATFIATNPLLDGTNYYYPVKIVGGRFIVGAGAQAMSDRVPFLVNTSAAPSQILLKRTPHFENVDILLTDSTAKGIGIYGGWGGIIRGGCIAAAGIDAIAVDIGGSSADGDTRCHPQELLVDAVTFDSCRPFASATNGCTNAAEGMTVRGSFFNFVRLAELNNINSLKWIGANQFVTDTKSLDIVDCSGVMVMGNYFESNKDPDNAAKPGIVNFQNCQDIKFVGNEVNVLATSVAVARDGILIKANSVNGMRGINVSANRFQHATYNAALETNAIRFATSGGLGQLLDVTVRDNCCNDWHNAVNFTDHIVTLATSVFMENITNNGGVRFVKGIARVAASALRAPGLYEQFSLVMSGQSIGGGLATNVVSTFWPTVMRSSAPVVTVSNFASLANCNGITATWAAIGANTVHIVAAQTAASAANALVQGQATITIDGTTV